MSTNAAERRLLEGMRVVEAGDAFGVRYAGRLLALLGADVTRLQPEPTIFDGYFNDGKTVVAASPGVRELAERAAGADVLIESLPQEEYEALAAESLSCIHVSISPAGRAGPGLSAGRLAGLALTGWMASEGEADGPPMGPGLPLAEYAAGLFAAIAATVANACPAEARPIMRFDISEAEALLRTMHSVTSVFSHTGVSQQRAGTAPVGLAKLEDGWLGIHALSADQVERLMAFLNIFAGLDTGGLATTADLSRAEVEAGLRASGHTAADLLRQGQEDFRLPFGLALTVPQLIECEHLRERDALRGSDEDGWYPARPFRMTERDGKPRTRPAPADGLILKGVKVVDLTMWFAGPIATQLLAELGADVVKIESPTHLDGYRLAAPMPGGQTWNRSPLHNTYSRGKRGLGVDLRTDEGREVVRRMIADADLVIENFSPGVMDRLGLSDEEIFAINPSVILASLPGFGFSGPWGGFTGFAFNIEEFAGWTALSGYEGQVPVCSRLGSADPTSGLHAAFILIAALTRPGGGRRIELSQQEALMELVGPAFSFYYANGRLPERTGGLTGIDGRVTRLYQAAGENQWVAADFDNEESSREVGDRLTRDRGATNGDGSWSRTLDRDALLAVLREAGITAYPIYEGKDAIEADVFVERGAFEDLEHPLTGLRRYPRSPLAINGWPAVEGIPAPLLGQHNAEVLAEAGYTQEEIADLTARGIAGDQPDRARYAAAWAIT